MLDHKKKQIETIAQTTRNVTAQQSLTTDQAQVKYQQELQEWTAQRAIQRQKASEIQQQFNQSNQVRKPSAWAMSLQRKKVAVASSLHTMLLRNQDELVMQRSAERVEQLRNHHQINVQRLAEDGIAQILPHEKNIIQRQYDDLSTGYQKNASPDLDEQRRNQLQQEAEQEIVGTLNRDARSLPFQVRLEWAEDIVKKYEQQGLDGVALRAFLNKKSQELYPQMGQIHQRHDQIKERQDQQKAQQLSSMQRQLEHYALQCQMEEAMTAHQEQNNLSIQERIAARAGQGQALENILSKQVLQQLQEKLNLGLEGIRIHTDSEAHVIAKNLGAIAFASGKNIYFQSGKFSPNTKAGFELLVHELSHVKQQLQGQAPPGLDEDAGLEAEAQNIGKILAEELFPVGDRPELQEEPINTEEETQTDEPTVIHLKRKPKVAEGQLAETGAVQRKKDPASQPGKQSGKKDKADDPTLQTDSPLYWWRRSGNLIGHPPVKETRPPNIKIKESETEYKEMYASAAALLDEQKARAETMKGKNGPTDFRYWFTKVYSFVTENELKFAREQAFHYPTYVMRCVLYFDKIYEDNLNAAKDKEKEVEKHWKEAFETARKEKELADDLTPPEELDFLKLGDKPYTIVASIYALVAHMLAHIRYDLPRAEAWVFDSYYNRSGVKIEDFRKDFFAMGGVFDNATRDMFVVMESEFKNMGDDLGKAFAEFTRKRSVGDDLMRDFLGANMGEERLETWKRTEELVDTQNIGEDPYDYVAGKKGKPGKLKGDATEKDLVSNTVDALKPDRGRPHLKGIKSKTLGEKFKGGLYDAAISLDDNETDNIQGGIGWIFDSKEKLSKLSWDQKSSLILKFMKGESVGMALKLLMKVDLNAEFDPVSGELAQKYVIKILRSCQNRQEFQLVVGACDAYSILRMLDGRDREEAGKMFAEKVYPEMGLSNAVNQCLKWIDVEGERSAEAETIYRSVHLRDKSIAYKIKREVEKRGRALEW